MAAIRKTARVEGLKDLERALLELPKATARNVLKRALTEAGAPIRAEAERRAPVLMGRLKRSHTVSQKLSRRQKAVHKKWAGALPATKTAQGWRSEPSKSVFVFFGHGPLVQAITQEFGTASHRPQPFMRPAWDSQKDRALKTLVERIGAEIASAVVRLARKAAREAARIKAGR